MTNMPTGAINCKSCNKVCYHWSDLCAKCRADAKISAKGSTQTTSKAKRGRKKFDMDWL